MPERDSGSKHAAKLVPKESHKKGCVTKHEAKFDDPKYPDCAYRPKGYDEIKKDSKKNSLYQIDFTQQHNATRLPRIYRELKIGFKKDKKGSYSYADDPRDEKKKKAWWIGEGKNYQIAYLPFNHNYHHILPFSALKGLNYKELDIIQGSGYNLNEGINLIILPCLREYGYAIMLPSHPYDHRVYTAHVKQIIDQIKQDINDDDDDDDHKVTKDNVGDFKSKTNKWEKKEFWVIVEYGQAQALKRQVADINKAPVTKA